MSAQSQTDRINILVSALSEASKAYVQDFERQFHGTDEVSNVGRRLIDAAADVIVIMEGMKEGQEQRVTEVESKIKSQQDLDLSKIQSFEQEKHLASLSIQQLEENITIVQTLKTKGQQWPKIVIKESDKLRVSREDMAIAAACLDMLRQKLVAKTPSLGLKYK